MFTPDTLDGCWLIVTCKSATDVSVNTGYGAVIALIRAGGKTVSILNDDFNNTLASSVSGNSITISNLPTYARCAIYELYTV